LYGGAPRGALFVWPFSMAAKALNDRWQPNSLTNQRGLEDNGISVQHHRIASPNSAFFAMRYQQVFNANQFIAVDDSGCTSFILRIGRTACTGGV